MNRPTSPYRRILAPVLHRPTSRLAQGLPPWSRVKPTAFLRSYSDESLKPGRLLVIEVFPPSGGSITLLVEVESCDPMPAGFAARYDIGMRVLRDEQSLMDRLEPVLSPS
ncbi:MAG TPA: hypothetical protein PLL32_06340 [Anaeromyxobacteraceae bacterium]|nr:hypothetical protein [Anaeromyxobacteraceae bacterium]